MAEQEQGSKKDFFAGLLLGGALGALIAILYAPERGENTRKVLADKSTEYAEVARVKGAEVAGSLKENAAVLSDKATDAIEVLKTKSTELGSTVASKATEVAAKANEVGVAVASKAVGG